MTAEQDPLLVEPTGGSSPTHGSDGRREPVSDARASDAGAPTRDEMTLALTPGQLAVGGAVVAGLLLVGARFVLGRRRSRG